MVSSWLLKVVLGIVLVGAAVIELGSPFVAKAQADDAAHEIADEAAFVIRDNFTEQAMTDSCKTEAAKHDVTIVTCDYLKDTDEVRVRVRKDARSFLLKKWSATEDWYHPEVTATSKRK